ncbi:MAG: CvpA family protein, partial [Clostridia bacterium]|nr:CvpA family protein [Clostridia bacterium]
MSLFLDLVLLVVLVMFVVLGAKKGFIRALLDGFSTLIAGVLAYTFVEPASHFAYDAFVRSMVRSSLSNSLDSTTNDFGSITERVEVLINKIPESAINFSQKLGFNIDAVITSIEKANPRDKDVLIDTIMTEVTDKIMMPLVETVTFIVLLVAFVLVLAIIIRLFDGIVKKVPVVKETDKIFGGLLGVLKGVV